MRENCNRNSKFINSVCLSMCVRVCVKNKFTALLLF